MIKDDTFYVTFHWMIKRLKLRGTELKVFAIIYGYSQNGDNWYYGSIKDLQEQCDASRQSVISALQSLVAKQFLIKLDNSENNIKTNYYKVNFEVVKKLDYGSKNLTEGSQKIRLGGSKNLTTDSLKIRPNNKDNNKYDNKLNNKECRAQRFVPPTLADIQDYIAEKNLSVSADRFYSYYESNGWRVGKNSMKSWKAALHSWNARDRQEKQQAKDNDGIDSTYDIDELEKRAMFGEIDI